jgi:hypothetical protein
MFLLRLGGLDATWAEKEIMTIARMAAATILLMVGTSLAMAQGGPPTGGYPPIAGGANGDPGRTDTGYWNSGNYYNYAGAAVVHPRYSHRVRRYHD